MENDFGETLKKIRQEKKVSIYQLAATSGISASQISRIENGLRGIPKPETTRKLSKALKMDFRILFEAAGYASEESIAEFDSYLKSFETTDRYLDEIFELMMTRISKDGEIYEDHRAEILNICNTFGYNVSAFNNFFKSVNDFRVVFYSHGGWKLDLIVMFRELINNLPFTKASNVDNFLTDFFGISRVVPEKMIYRSDPIGTYFDKLLHMIDPLNEKGREVYKKNLLEIEVRLGLQDQLISVFENLQSLKLSSHELIPATKPITRETIKFLSSLVGVRDLSWEEVNLIKNAAISTVNTYRSALSEAKNYEEE